MDDLKKELIEVILFTGSEPISETKLTKITGIAKEDIANYVKTLNEEYENTGRTFRIFRFGNAYQFLTLPHYHKWLAKVEAQERARLSRASLETLAIIAYRQPISKVEIDTIRGVDSSGPLSTLLEKKLVDIDKNRAGRPRFYITTEVFLRMFGLKDLKELPPLEEEWEKEKKHTGLFPLQE